MTSDVSSSERRTPVPWLAAGVVLALGAGVAAWLGPLVGVSALTASVVVGAVVGNLRLVPRAAQPTLGPLAKRLLRAGIVLLGARLAVGDLLALGGPALVGVLVVVAITFTGTLFIGRQLHMTGQLPLLVAVGFSICGASAVSAASGVIDAEDEEVAYAIALVTLCGTLAIFVLPPLAALLGLDAVSAGRWVGLGVHDVGQVVATASAVGPQALEPAIITKLGRVVLLGPVLLGLGASRRGSGRQPAASTGTARPPLIPLFVLGFLAMAVVRSLDILPSPVVDLLRTAEGLLLAAALFGLGVDVDVRRLARLGGRGLALGLTAWLVVALVALGVVAVIG